MIGSSSVIGSVGSGASLVVAALVLLSALSYDWVIVLAFLVNGNGFSERTERVIAIVASVIIVILVCLGLGFGISYGIHLSELLNVPSIALEDIFESGAAFQTPNLLKASRGYAGIGLICIVMIVLLSFFLVGSSAAGIVTLKRRDDPRDNQLAIGRLFVIAFVLLLGCSIRAVHFFTSLAFWSGPRWFIYGFVNIGTSSLITISFMVFCFFAFYGAHRQRTGRVAKDDMSVELLSPEGDSGAKRNSKKTVPLAYQI